ncbi:MAG: hypothetical protein ACRDHP_05855 [Ktedonobacterales bacterium]
MSHTITLNIPDDVARRARDIANQTQRRMEDVLLEWLDTSANDLPVELLSDAEVLALRDQEMSATQQHELSDLLGRQREGHLDARARVRLEDLLGIYRHGMVRKAQALKVAVERGLQHPVN